VRPHARRILGTAAYSDLALAAGQYLNERGLRAHQRLDRADWLSLRLARHTRQALREIVAKATREPCPAVASGTPGELTPTGR
jgi:hypothetical protein